VQVRHASTAIITIIIIIIIRAVFVKFH